MSDATGQLEDPILDELKHEAHGAIEVLHNDLSHPDYKARQTAAKELLDRAGYSAKGKDDAKPPMIINLNLGRLVEGLRQVGEIGFERSGHIADASAATTIDVVTESPAP
jgi:hypothetical protein